MGLNDTTIARGFVKRLDEVGLQKAVKELAALLIEDHLHGQIEQIIADISREYTKKHGIVEAQARTVFPLSESLKKELSERVKQATAAENVILHEEIDKSILGGVIINAPDMELDLSLKTKLAKLRA